MFPLFRRIVISDVSSTSSRRVLLYIFDFIVAINLTRILLLNIIFKSFVILLLIEKKIKDKRRNKLVLRNGFITEWSHYCSNLWCYLHTNRLLIMKKGNITFGRLFYSCFRSFCYFHLSDFGIIRSTLNMEQRLCWLSERHHQTVFSKQMSFAKHQHKIHSIYWSFHFLNSELCFECYLI